LTEIRRALITGAAGQLGRELAATQPQGWEVMACGRDDLDVGDTHAVGAYVETHRPSVIINAAGYTAVDRAESERAAAFRVNSLAPGYLAESLARVGGRLIQVSTDFVFDGTKSSPYLPTDTPRPLSAYGESKRGGEERVLQVLGSRAVVVRTSWVYSAHGNNFVRTMLRLIRERNEIRVVDDQIGTPTWARNLAHALWRVAERSALSGVHHWTDAGVASWYDFAVAIQEEALARQLIARAIPIVPIRTEDYPVPAARPAYSVLDKQETWTALGVVSPHWRDALRAMMAELPRE